MCTEAAEVHLASLWRYQRRQAEELLSPGVSAHAGLNISQSFLLFLSFSSSHVWFLSRRLSISLSRHFPNTALPPSLFLGESIVLCSPMCAQNEKLRWWRVCSYKSYKQEWLRELHLSGLFMIIGLMGSKSVVPSGHNTTGFSWG